MAVFLVTFDLRKPEHDYAPFYERLRRYDHVEALKTAWLVDSARYAGQIRDDLFEAMDQDDGLLIVLMEGEAGWNRLEGEAQEWLLRRFRVTGPPR